MQLHGNLFLVSWCICIITWEGLLRLHSQQTQKKGKCTKTLRIFTKTIFEWSNWLHQNKRLISITNHLLVRFIFYISLCCILFVQTLQGQRVVSDFVWYDLNVFNPYIIKTVVILMIYFFIVAFNLLLNLPLFVFNTIVVWRKRQK